MSALCEYVQRIAVRGACTCGKCVDAEPDPEKHQPSGHTADVFFFNVAARNGADADALRNLIDKHEGEFSKCNPLDGKEHSYLELGEWIGDQGLALMLMGVGAVLGLWKLLTPKMLSGLPDDLMQQMAGAGFVSIAGGKAETGINPREQRKGNHDT